jgi:transposase
MRRPSRRLAEGKTRREAIRCLKRYIAREIFHPDQPKITNPGVHRQSSTAA